VCCVHGTVLLVAQAMQCRMAGGIINWEECEQKQLFTVKSKFVFREWGKPQKTSARIWDISAETRNRHLPNKIERRHHLSQLLRPLPFLKNAVFWGVAPCRCGRLNRRFEGSYRLHLQGRKTVLQLPAHAGSSLADFSTLKMEAIRSFETSVQSTTSTRHHTPEDGILHRHRRENLKSSIPVWLI
jgi:hypothetical protein